MPYRNSSATSDNVHLSVYAAGEVGVLSIRGGAAYTRHAINTTRTPTFPGFAETLNAQYDAGTAQLFGELGYPLDLGAFTIEPFVGLAGVLHHTDAFAETGGLSAVSSAGGIHTAAIATIGINASTTFTLGDDMEITAHGTLRLQAGIRRYPDRDQRVRRRFAVHRRRRSALRRRPGP